MWSRYYKLSTSSVLIATEHMTLARSQNSQPASRLSSNQIAALRAAPDTLPSCLPFKRNILRSELHAIVPLGDTTIYELEQRGEFPKRFYLTPRCVVWDLDEVEAWVKARRSADNSGEFVRAAGPDVRLRRQRPVRP